MKMCLKGGLNERILNGPELTREKLNSKMLICLPGNRRKVFRGNGFVYLMPRARTAFVLRDR